MSIKTIQEAIERRPELLPRLLAVCEPTRAYPDAITKLSDILPVLRGHLDGRTTEAFCVVAMNRKNHVLGSEILTTGTESSCIVDPRLVLSWALRQGAHGASAIIIAHNHPSGDVTPSRQDFKMTRKMKKACESVGITLHDSLIITKDSSLSCMP